MNDIVERLTAGLQVIERRLVAPKSPHEIEFGLAFREILTETRDEIVRLQARLAEAEAERDEYYARAVSLLAFVPGDVKAGDLQEMRADFKAWKEAQRKADSASDDYRKPCADCGELTDVWHDGTHLCWKCRA